ncbi:hypothetical protein MKL29_08575 [Streptococcus suis]|nr:hypothetical protein [Streptococcus suis]
MRKTQVLLTLLVVGLFGVNHVSADARVPTPNGYIDTSQKIIPNGDHQYVPPNVQDVQAQKAIVEKKKQSEKKQAETKIEEDKHYQKIKEAASRADKIYAKKNPTTKELKQADRDTDLIRQFTEQNKQYEMTSQYASLKQTLALHDTDSLDLKKQASEREFLDNYLENAKNATDPGKLSKLTSYIYVEDGFFGTKDLFPKAVNALGQGIFFLAKVTYLLVMIIMEQLFSGNAYEQLDAVVETSAKMFDTVMVDYRYAVFGFVLVAGLVEMYRQKRFPFGIFKFGLVWALALFLYSPASLPNYGNEAISAKYNLSRLIKAVDGAGATFTQSAITSFDSLDNTNRSVSAEGSDLSKVKEAIFNEMVYEPFMAMNFSEASSQIPEDKVKELIKTNGLPDDVKEYYKKNKNIARLSYDDIGMKLLVSIASLIKALILGVALIGLGLVSLVFKYLVMILLVSFVLVLLIAMLPSFEHVLAGVFKKIIQFVFIGSLGLFFIRAFLYVNSLIEGMAHSMTTFYFWSAFIQGAIWVMIYWFRHLFFDVFIRGTLNAQEIGRKAQTGLNRISLAPLPQTKTVFRQPQAVSRTQSSSGENPVSFKEPLSLPRTSRLGTLKRAGYNLAGSIGHQLKTDYENIRFGDNEQAKQKAGLKRAALFQRVKDVKDDVAYMATMPKFYGLRSKLHDLAGDEGTPSQEIFKARQRGREDRRQWRSNRYRHHQPSMMPQSLEDLKLPSLPKTPKKASSLERKKPKNSFPPQPSSPLEPFTSDDLYEKT